MTDLKMVLMQLGNKLVTEHKFDPATQRRLFTGDEREVVTLEKNSTAAIKAFTDFMNANPAAQAVLKELGFDWSMHPKLMGQS